MLEVALKIISVLLFLGSAVYAIQLRKHAPPVAWQGLRQIRDGFLAASALSLITLLPEETFTLSNGEFIRVGSIIGIGLGIALALRGLSQWQALGQKNQAVIKVPTEEARALDTSEAAESVDLVSFVNSCLGWSNSTIRISSPHTLAGSFLKLLTETLGLGSSGLALLAMSSASKVAPPITLAVYGIDGAGKSEVLSQISEAASAGIGRGCVSLAGRRYVCLSAMSNADDSVRTFLLYESHAQSATTMHALGIGLNLFTAALQRQTLTQQLARMESDRNVSDLVHGVFKSSFHSNFDGESGTAEFRMPQIVFETLERSLRELGPEVISADCIIVESSKQESEMTISLTKRLSPTQSDSGVQPRIGFYPYSRRLRFYSERREDATLIRVLPVFDSRRERQRIMDERLRSLVHGVITVDPLTELMVVIGSRKSGTLGESQREIVAQILREIQGLVDFAVLPNAISQPETVNDEHRLRPSDITNDEHTTRRSKSLSLTF